MLGMTRGDQACTVWTVTVRRPAGTSRSVLSLAPAGWLKLGEIHIKILKLSRLSPRFDPTDEEVYAIHRDAASGGIVRVSHMKPTGFEVTPKQDSACNNLHYISR